MCKKILATCALTLGFILSENPNIFSQIQVGSAETSKGPGKITKENMAKFKQSTTYFILQERDYENLEAFEKAIKKVWTVTPFKIIMPHEMSEKDEATSSFFFFGGYNVTRHGSMTSTSHTHLSYNLIMLSTNKKNKVSQETFAKILLHLDSEGYMKVTGFSNGSNRRFSEKLIPYLYKDAQMQNWSPLMLSGYLKVINDGLINEKLRSVYDDYVDKNAIKALQNNKLYIPSYVNNKFNMFTGGENDKDENEEDLKSAYSFPAQYIDLHDLDIEADNNPKGLYYLSYIRSSTDKYVSVFNSLTGEMIYTNYVPLSYNFKFKDIRKINSKVK